MRRVATHAATLLVLLLAGQAAAAQKVLLGPRRALRQDETSTEASPVAVGGDMGVKGLEQASNQMGIGNPAVLAMQPGALQTGGAPQGAPGGWSLPPARQQYGPQVYVPALTTAGGGGGGAWGGGASQPTGGPWGKAAANQPAAPGVHPWPAGPPTSAPHSWGGGGSWGAATAKTPAVVFYIASSVSPPPPPYPNKALLFQENNPTVARIGQIIRTLRR